MLNLMTQEERLTCKNCGADLDRSDPQGPICTASRKYESSCNIVVALELDDVRRSTHLPSAADDWTPPSEIAATRTCSMCTCPATDVITYDFDAEDHEGELFVPSCTIDVCNRHRDEVNSGHIDASGIVF